MYSWIVTATCPVFLSLSIQPGFTTIHSRRCSSIILWNDRSQWHLRFPRFDDNHQWWRHPWSGWCFWTLNMNYGLHKQLYSLTLSACTDAELCNEHTDHMLSYSMLQLIVSWSGGCLKLTSYCAYLKKTRCVNIWHFGQPVRWSTTV